MSLFCFKYVHNKSFTLNRDDPHLSFVHSFLEPTRNVKRVLSKHNKLKMMKQFEKLKKKKMGVEKTQPNNKQETNEC